MAQDARRAMRAEGVWFPSPSGSETSTPAPSPAPTQRRIRPISLETSIPTRDLRFMDRPEPRTLPSPSPEPVRRHRGACSKEGRHQIHVHVNSPQQAQSHIPQSDLDRLTSQEITDLRQVREYWQQARATLESAHERAGSPPQRRMAPLVIRPSSPTVDLRHQPRAVRFQRPEYLVPQSARSLRPIPASPPRPIRTLIAGRLSLIHI